MKKERLDEEFEQLWERAVARSEQNEPADVPDPEASWLRMRRKLDKERRRSGWLRSAKWLSVTAASLGIGAFLFHSLQTTEAFRTMHEMVYKTKGGGVSINVVSRERPDPSGAKTPPPPDEEPAPKLRDHRDLPEESAFRRKIVAFEDAYTETQFTVPRFGYIPAGFAPKETTVHYSMGESKGSAVRFIYEREDGPKQLKAVVRKRAFSAEANRPDGRREFSENADGTGLLEWNDQDISIVLQGELGKEELNRIADGMSRSK